MTTEALQSDLPNLKGFWLWLARVVWVLLALLCISQVILGTVVQYNFFRMPCDEWQPQYQTDCQITERALHQLGLTLEDQANIYTPIATVSAVPWILIGCLVYWRKSASTIGLLFSLVLVSIGSNANQYWSGYLIATYPVWNIANAILRSLANLAPPIIFFLFPDGRFVPRWTRWLLIFWIGCVLYDSSSRMLITSFGDSVWSRFLYLPILLTMIASAIYAITFRYRHDAGPLQREQIKWVVVSQVAGAILTIGHIILLQFWRPGFYDVLLTLVYDPLFYLIAVLLGAVCFGISISLYRLWDIDFLINRTLVYSLLTAFIVSLYVIVVGILGTAIQGSGNLLVSILATGFVAILVQPLRDGLQRSINRLMYGERDDPVTVLARLGQRLQATIAPDAIPPALVETVAQTLKLPYAAISLGVDSDGEIAASYGRPTGELTRLPLTHHGETIGQLVVAPRSPGEAFSPADYHLLNNIAHQAGMAVHAVSLTVDLQRSRQRLVTTREEERRRLRRDLHDGLGPNLASQGLKLAAVRQLLESDPTNAGPLLDQVMAQNKSTVEDVRRLVYGLRPPALDELGLVAAIRDYVAGTDRNGLLHIEITTPPKGLPSLSAAVEVAAYRIVLEAITNVIRHAQANSCSIRFSLDRRNSNDSLQIEIQDDGIGLPKARRSGVGTRSMRERAEELGGTYVVESFKGHGTRVCVKVPLTDM